LDEEAIRTYVASTFKGVDVKIGSKEDGSPEIAWGDTFFIYDPQRNLEGTGRFPFATIVTKDYGDFDNASKLDRPGVFRLNIGISRKSFDSLFPDEVDHDFTALNVYAPSRVQAQPLGVRSESNGHHVREAPAAAGRGIRHRLQADRASVSFVRIRCNATIEIHVQPVVIAIRWYRPVSALGNWPTAKPPKNRTMRAAPTAIE